MVRVLRVLDERKEKEKAEAGRPPEVVVRDAPVVRTAGRLMAEVVFLRWAVLGLLAVVLVEVLALRRVALDREPGVVLVGSQGAWGLLPVEWRTSGLPRAAAEVLAAGLTLSRNLLDDTSDSFDHQLEVVTPWLSRELAEALLADWRREVDLGGGRKTTVYELRKTARKTCRVDPVPGQARAFVLRQGERDARYRYEGLFTQACRQMDPEGRLGDPVVRHLLAVYEMTAVRRTPENPLGLVAETAAVREVDAGFDVRALPAPKGWTPLLEEADHGRPQ